MQKWGDNVRPATIEHIVQSALASGALETNVRAAAFHDLTLLESRLTELRNTFPPSTLHAIAVKANPLVSILRRIVGNGCGLETASFEEVHTAAAAGCSPENIVFDSPVKTLPEIRESLQAGYVINVDNFAELERINKLRNSETRTTEIGLRINPMVGPGKIAITSVADGASKFGVRIDTERAAILRAFEQYEWLNGLHIHIGSQGCELDMLVDGARQIASLLEDISRVVGENRIRFVDIGGGLPVAYTDQDSPPELAEYVDTLRNEVPTLFSGPHRLITEFGRAVQAGCGFAVAKVEYVKPYGDHELAAIHLGADMFMRPVYLPAQWPHRCMVLDNNGNAKQGESKAYSIGGPLCFAGDLLFRKQTFPVIEPEDYIVIRDTGAYTISMWSRHCSRSIPGVIGYETEPRVKFSRLFNGETPETVAEFWT